MTRRTFSTTAIAIVASATALAACSSQAPEEDEVEAAYSGPPPLGVVSLSGAPGECGFSWDGETSSAGDIVARARTAMEDAIEAAGGAEAMTEENMPFVALEAEADAAFGCAAEAIRTLTGPGVPQIGLRIAGSAAQQNAYLLYAEPSSIGRSNRIDLGSNGMILWGGRSMSLSGARERARSLGGTDAENVLVPTVETRFGDVYDLLVAASENGLTLTLSGCSLDEFGSATFGDQIEGTHLPTCEIEA